MSQVIELKTSREMTNTSSTYRYVIIEATDEPTAITAMLGVAPTSDRGLFRSAYSIAPEGAGIFSGRVEYGVFSNEPNQQTVNVEIGGQNQKITHSRGTTAYAPTGETAPDHHGAIGVSKDGKEIGGCEIIVPTMTLSVTRTLAPASANAAIAVSKGLVGRINNAPISISGLSFDTHEVLYNGLRCSRRGNEVWDFSYSFLISDNETGIVIGDITVASKDGWQYLWVDYGQTDDTAANRIVAKPIAAYVEDVYLDGDMTALGLS